MTLPSRYHPRLNMALSPLGFGVMRLPMNPDGSFPDQVRRLLAEAYESGINYFDTAFPYLGGRSEELVREALVARYPRESFYIADKLPVWDCRDAGDMERIFNIQLERLGTGYIDFYLLHGLHESRWRDIYGLGVLAFLDRKRAEGVIRKVGFSFHDTADVLVPIADAYDWDFAQLQINYYDWKVQRAEDAYGVLQQRDIPCMVMEPVGGGRLARLPDSAEQLLKDRRPGASAASWAMRFVADLPNVVVTLSGMSDREQLADNLAVFASAAPLSDTERAALNGVVEIMIGRNTIPCTACGYCVADCPKNVDIPQIFKRYNDHRQFDGLARFDLEYHAFLPEGRRASNCVSCGKCVKQCPQNIDVPEELRMIHNLAVKLATGADVERLKEALSGGSRLVCFGAGAAGRGALSLLRGSGIGVDYFCDNAQGLWGTEVDGVTVISPGELKRMASQSATLTLVTSGAAKAIQEQLLELDVPILTSQTGA